MSQLSHQKIFAESSAVTMLPWKCK